VLVGVCAGLGAGFPLVAKGQTQSPFIGVDEIREGMTGYGFSTFHGTEPEKFDAKVVGIVHNFSANGEDLILVMASGGPDNRVNVVKNVHGMSGSPVYFNGRLAGAYAWSLANFTVEPIIGVTPIKSMVPHMSRPIPPGFFPLEPSHHGPAAAVHAMARPPRSTSSTFDGAPGGYDLAAHAQQVAARMTVGTQGVTPAAVPMMLGGVGTHTARELAKIFEPMGIIPVQAGGGGNRPTDPNAPLHFKAGSGLGVPYATGDVALTTIGTATYVDGTKVAAFGHPMDNAGDTALPTCIATTTWIMASELASFKVGECARPLGALFQDRPTAVVLDETRTAPTFPVDLDVEGVPGLTRTHWHVISDDDKFVSPAIVATVVGSVVELTTQERRDVTWDMHSKIRIEGHGTIELDDIGVAVGGMPDRTEWFQSRAVRAVGNVLNNPWQDAHVEGVEQKLTVRFTRDVWRLRGVELLDPVVDAGEKAHIRLRLLPFAGPEVDRTVEVTMPASLAGKDVDVEVVPGYDVAPELAAPENLEQLLANEQRQSYDPHTVVVQYKVPEQGVSFNGHVAPELPTFALDQIRPQTTDLGPDNFTSYVRTSFPIDKYLDGRDKVRVHVRAVVR
jgi:hypothetical protein